MNADATLAPSKPGARANVASGTCRVTVYNARAEDRGGRLKGVFDVGLHLPQGWLVLPGWRLLKGERGLHAAPPSVSPTDRNLLSKGLRETILKLAQEALRS